MIIPPAKLMLTAAELRQELDVPANMQPSRLDRLAAAVVELWERSTGRLWQWRQDHEMVKQLDHATDRKVWLDLYPVETISVFEWRDASEAVRVVPWFDDLSTGSGPSTMVGVAATDFTIDNTVGRINLVRSDLFLGWVKTVSTGGYDRDSCPALVKEAMITQAKFMSRRLSGDAMILNSQGFARGSASYMEANLHPFFTAVAADNERYV